MFKRIKDFLDFYKKSTYSYFEYLCYIVVGMLIFFIGLVLKS